MPPEHQPPRLFTLRLWQAAVDDAPGALEWRGKVQSLPDGEAYCFRDWPGLIRHLDAMLETPRAEAAHSETQDGGNL